MNKKTILSVAIPTYNGVKFLEKNIVNYIAECNKKKFKNFIELIILDNASNDKTSDVVKYYQKFLLKNKNIKIFYKRQIKNVGYYRNFINLLHLVKSNYILILSDCAVPELGFYNELYQKLYNQNINKLMVCPTQATQKYTQSYLGINKLSYILNRGSMLSGFILKKKNISFKYVHKNLYVQNIIFINYFLEYGMVDLEMNKKIIFIKKQFVHEKFNDRMDRKIDYAIFDKIKTVEVFYERDLVNFFQYFICIYKIYEWSMEIKYKIYMEKKYELEKLFFFEILKYKKKSLLFLIFILLFLKKSHNNFFFYLRTVMQLITKIIQFFCKRKFCKLSISFFILLLFIFFVK
jgi:glycosyltransferase involved in cell wall biosynthesis